MTLYRPPTAFSTSPVKGKRRPRVHANDHLRWIRTLPCVLTGKRPVEAAHIRFPDPRYGKRAVGMSEKPDDRWTVPLSPAKHREQHGENEHAFWQRHGVDPCRIALSLWGASGDDETAEIILREALDSSARETEQTVVSAELAFVQMIERVTVDPNADIGKLERLLAMKRGMEDRAAEREFNEAMSLAQAEMTAISADATNPQTKSKYASYAALDRVLRPIYTRHSFSLSFDTGDGAPEGFVRVLCYVARGSHTRTYRADMPADGKGAKGGDVMTKTHATGAAFTYGARYLLKMIFNVAIGETDDDGNGASSTAITDEQVATLRRLIIDGDADIAKVCQFLKVERIEDLPARDYQKAVNALEQHARKAVKK